MAGKAFDLARQMIDAISDAASIRFEFRLTGAPTANAATQAREARALTGETGEQITKLRQLDLHLAFPAMCPLCKDIENELCSIDDRQVGNLRNCTDLGRSQILIENEEVRALLHGLRQYVLEFTASQLKPMAPALCALHYTVDHREICGGGKFCQLSEMFFLLRLALGRCAHEDGGLTLGRLVRSTLTLKV